MLRALLELLPEVVRGVPMAVAVGVAATGLLLSLAGARQSRSFLSLALVALGTVAGWHMPDWFGWKVDPMGPAFGAAILLGLSGFILSGFWETVLLSILLAAWGGAMAWIALARGETWGVAAPRSLDAGN